MISYGYTYRRYAFDYTSNVVTRICGSTPTRRRRGYIIVSAMPDGVKASGLLFNTLKCTDFSQAPDPAGRRILDCGLAQLAALVFSHVQYIFRGRPLVGYRYNYHGSSSECPKESEPFRDFARGGGGAIPYASLLRCPPAHPIITPQSHNN